MLIRSIFFVITCAGTHAALELTGSCLETYDDDYDEHVSTFSLLQHSSTVAKQLRGAADGEDVTAVQHRYTASPIISTHRMANTMYDFSCPRMNASAFAVAGADQLLTDIQDVRNRTLLELQRATQDKNVNASRVAMRRLEAVAADAVHFKRGTLRLWNPSLVQMPANWRATAQELWLAIFRFQTEEFLGKDARMAQDMPRWFSSHIVLAVLDSNLYPVRPVVVLGSQHVANGTFDCQPMDASSHGHSFFGPEDPRLFLNEGTEEVMVFWTGRAHGPHLDMPCASKRGQRMSISRLGSDLQPVATGEIMIGNGVSLELQPIEKNWSPFMFTSQETSENHVLVEYSVSPHVVGRLSFAGQSPSIDQTWNTSSDTIDDFVHSHNGSHAHGSAGPIRYRHQNRDVYVSILHTLMASSAGVKKKKRVMEYKSALFTFEASPPFRILAVSNQWLPLMPRKVVWKTKVAFPTQLLDMRNAGQQEFWIMYGQGDCESARLIMSAEEFASYLPS